MLKACFCMFCFRSYTCSRCIFTTKHQETLDRHWGRVHGVKRRGGWGCQFVFPEVDTSRYNKHIQKRHAGQPYREGVVVGKGKRAPRSMTEKVPVRKADSPVNIPECFGSADPLHLDSSWEEEPEGGFIELMEEVGVTNIPLSPLRSATCDQEAPVINGIVDKRVPWKLIPIDIPTKDRKLRDPHIKKM